VLPFILYNANTVPEIRFTQHAQTKLEELRELGVEITQDQVKVDYAEEAGDFILHDSEEGELVLIEVFHATRFLLSLLSSMIKQEEVVLT
jgi:uncharacterized protein YuzE